jgi:ribbon-helix-helix CopG family protein
MSNRLQVLISPELDAQLEKAAQRSRVSKGEWVRRALNDSLRQARKGPRTGDPVARMASLNGPVADIAQMLDEIEAGRS